MSTTPHGPHHARVARHGKLSLLWGALFVIAALPWLFLRTLMCTGRLGSEALCQKSFTVPLGLVLLVGLESVVVLLAMAALGKALAPLAEGTTFARHRHHVREGYRRLDAKAHRPHVRRTHWAVWSSLATVFAFWGWFVLYLPPLAAYGVAAAVLGVGGLLDRVFFGPDGKG